MIVLNQRVKLLSDDRDGKVPIPPLTEPETPTTPGLADTADVVGVISIGDASTSISAGTPLEVDNSTQVVGTSIQLVSVKIE